MRICYRSSRAKSGLRMESEAGSAVLCGLQMSQAAVSSTTSANKNMFFDCRVEQVAKVKSLVEQG